MKRCLAFILSGFIFSSCSPDLDVLEYTKANISINLVFPEKDSECTEGSAVSDTQSEVVFEWIDERSSEPYIVHLTNISNSETVLIESKNTETPIVLEKGTPYSWYVTGKHNTSSEVWTFYNEGNGIESFIPFPATALSPISGASISRTSTTVNLRWNAEDLDNDIVGYDLYFGESTDPELLISDIETSSYSGIPVTSGKTYYWQIVTRDSIGNESSSAIFSFSVG
ncbi:fibronectin type III domain-containing protein [Maribacter thermophilus]|uniref:hypothetical protein n=1 Tax=Maribacter thermophilus TaxID=1197874 RepID=UPI00069CA3CA|nr:hypothetical protein [Maribacter thermophilus]